MPNCFVRSLDIYNFNDSRNLKSMKTLFMVCISLFWVVQSSVAVVTISNSQNTNTPPGGCGQRHCAVVDGDKMVEIFGPHAALTAQHLNITIGQSVVKCEGKNYLITNTCSMGDLTVLLVVGTFPSTSRAVLLTNPIEIGKTGYMWGRGNDKGAMVTNWIYPDLTLSNPDVCSNTVGVSGRVGTQFVLQYSTNLTTPWISTCLTNAIPSNGCATVGLPCGGPQAFFRVQVLPTLITNGWMNGNDDHLLRWAINTISGTTNGYLFSRFSLNGNPNTGCAWPGDSGGGFFIQEDGVWKLAGIIQGVDQGVYHSPSTGDTPFYGMMVDRSGLELWDVTNTQKQLTYTVSDGPNPILTYYTRVSDYWWWLEQFTH